jgi:hypothetical protein
MKARQIAPALTSVFAIDHEGQIRVIERGTDGLWGRWQPTGIAASRRHRSAPAGWPGSLGSL